MSNTSIRRTGELLRKLFEILIPAPLPAREALQRLEANVTLSEYEAGNYEAGDRRFEKIVRFATVDCVKAGWLQKTRGVWAVTEDGLAAYKSLTDPEAFYRRATVLYREWRATQPDAAPLEGTDASEEVGDKAVRITFEEAEEQAWSEIEQFLRVMKPYDFQDLVADLLRAMGYHVTWIAPPGKDGGMDILAWPDPLATRPPRIKVQVKRQVQAVAVDGLRSFMALLEEDDVGIFVNLGGFTKDAQDSARTQARRKVTLVDGDRLVQLWIEHYNSLSDEARRRMPLRPIYYLSPGS